MYVILTSKPGQFRTEPTPGLAPVEAWDYLLHDKQRARFVIAAVEGTPRIRVVEEADPALVNSVPVKFLQHFDTLEGARREIRTLTAFGRINARLEPVAP
jgi:hypothetical protein